jgi:hypothetical protein
LDSEFVTETITSFMQEKFEKSRYNDDNKNSKYVTNYARQLEVIFGNNLFKSDVRNNRDISDLFKIFPVREKIDPHVILHSFISLFSTINNGIEKENNAYKVDFANTIFELNMTLLLNSYLEKHKELSQKEIIDKIESLINLQKSPNFDAYKSIIQRFCKDKTLLNDNKTLKFVLNPEPEMVVNDRILKEKYVKYLALKLFGFSDVIDYKNNPLFSKGNGLYSYSPKYYDYIKNQNYYNLMATLRFDANMDMTNSKIEEVYSPIVNNSTNLLQEIKDGKDYSNKKLSDYKYYSSQERSFLFKATKNKTSIYVLGDYNPVIFIKQNIFDVLKKNYGVLKQHIPDAKARSSLAANDGSEV